MKDLKDLVRPNVWNMKPYSSARDEFQGNASVFLDANENPFNRPYNRYPDPLQWELKKKIAEIKGVKRESIFLGNGSDEPIDLIIRAFCEPSIDSVVSIDPSYGMYEVAANVNNVEFKKIKLDGKFDLDTDSLLEAANDWVKVIFLCSPNNPTGNYNPLEVMEKILANVSCPVVMDEAYMEFAKGSGVDPQDLRPLNKLKLVAGSTLALTGKYSNFMCLRTFSKAYGLAGLRVGYAVGSAGIMRVLGKTLLPYHVNAWSLAVAEEAYRQKDLYKEQLETIIEQRDLMREQLEQMGLKIWPSATNFLTCCPQGELTARLAAACEQQYGSQGEKTQQMLAGMYLYRKLLEKKILVRDYTSHPVLQGCLRITVGLPLENAEIISQLERLCGEEAI